ncbi:MAG: Imm63 family immunity protein [Sphingorhabdus sp.]
MIDHDAIAVRHAELLSQMMGEARESDAYRSLDDHEGQLLLIDADGYHWVSYERGQENGRRSTRDVDELLFWFLEQTAFSIGCAHEFANRVEGPDFRRMVHAKERELFGRLSPEWAERLEQVIAATLAEHPYLDSDNAVHSSHNP